jgi:alpha-L-fucosidase
MIIFKNILLFTLMSILSLIVSSQESTKNKRSSVALKYGAQQVGRRNDSQMETWRNYGLGQFVHWGVYSIPGGHWNGKYYPGAAEWIRSWSEMPKKEYDNLYKKFNPEKFDPKSWARMAKNMGVRYFIITTKHHDGFCLWPSKFTTYTIESSLYKKDIIKQLVDAYQTEGIDVYLYFSIIDWNHPDYMAKIKNSEDRLKYQNFLKFTRNQLLELVDLYPSVKGFWFDGTWEEAWYTQAEFALELEKELKNKIPGLIIGSRFRADENGKRHFDSNGDLIGDYEQGWERKLPKSMEELNGNDWECVMTIPENQWGYHSKWEGHVKTTNELLEMLVKSISLDGNFVLNFGPTDLGEFRNEELKLAEEIGQWMNINKNAVYDCGYAGLEKQDWGYFTKNQKTGKIYLTVFNVPVDGAIKVKLEIGMEIQSAHQLTDGVLGPDLKTENIVGFEHLIYLQSKNLNRPLVIELILKQTNQTIKTEAAKT